MKVTFFSNYMNHHQLPIAEEFMRQGVEYAFIATEPISNERLSLGYEDMNKKYSFIITTYDSKENEDKAMELCKTSDVIILGSAPEKYIMERLKSNKLTFRYSERYFKMGLLRLLDPRLFYNMRNNNVKYKKSNFYLLVSSAYAAWDFNVYGAFKNKCYKWGYFPRQINCDIEETIENKKQKKKIDILWCGRLIEWKHPEKAIFVAEKLQKEGIKFKLKIIGNGILENKLKKIIRMKNLEEFVELVGSVPANEVRKYMQDSDIYLFTSDYMEGWGAVLNESMNSACAVVASHAIGAVPFLIKDKINGLIYNNSDNNDLYQKVKSIIINREFRLKLSKNAYDTIINIWNPENAVKNFLHLVDLLNNEKKMDIDDGPCSIAKPIFQGKMYNILVNNNETNGD